MHYVVGSGPAGIAGAAALIAAGKSVTLLDVGLDLDADCENRRLRMAGQSVNEWSAEDNFHSRSHVGADGHLEAKLRHGSDYPYRQAPSGIYIDYGNLAVRSSAAKGGLSNVWGAALLPFHQRDTLDWPIAMEELAEAHRAVLRLMPVSGVHDDLESLLPLHADSLQSAKRSVQAAGLLSDLSRNRSKLNARGVTFGSARLAVRFAGMSAREACNYCGHCMHGCPRDLIYSSRHTLSDMISVGKLKYVPHCVVQSASEQGASVAISALVDGRLTQFSAERVYVAEGVFNSTALLLRCLKWYDRPIRILDSQYFIFPLIRAIAAPSVEKESLHSLAQVFLEISHEPISPYLIHLQIYGFNDSLADILRHRLRMLWRLVPRNAFLGRLLIAQGFLHSAHSGYIEATLKQPSGNDVLSLRAIESKDAPARIRRLIRHLCRLSTAMRAFPISPALQICQPGRSFHCGGSFPMSRNPRPGEVDILGRPFGRHRIHVIDSTVFPSIPATTITQTVMANAYRIATGSTQLDH